MSISLVDYSKKTVVVNGKELSFDEVNAAYGAIVQINNSRIEEASSGKKMFTLSVSQTFSVVLTVKAKNKEDAIDYVNDSFVLFTDADYVSGSAEVDAWS
jgi:hypothetical protein